MTLTVNLTSDEATLLLAVLNEAEDNAHRTAYNKPDNARAQQRAQSLTNLLNAFLI